VNDHSDIRLVAFDLGGVMIEVDELIPVATFADLSGRSADEAFAAIYAPEKKRLIETGSITSGEHARRAIEILGLTMNDQEFWQIHCTSHTPQIAVGQIIAAVAQHSHITIASNLPEPHWEWTLANLHYAHLFDPPILSFELGVMKPDAGYFEKMLQLANADAAKVFFTDDLRQNVAAATAAGIRAFQFTGPEKLLSDLKSCGVRV
jgi:FMN phosphatase YigB (HAD superfamily)